MADTSTGPSRGSTKEIVASSWGWGAESGKFHGGGTPWVLEEEDFFKQTGVNEARTFLADGSHDPLFNLYSLCFIK